MGVNLDELEAAALKAIDAAADLPALDAVRVKYLGKKGELTSVLRGLGALQEEERRQVGQQANEVKGRIGQVLEARHQALSSASMESHLSQTVDLTLPGDVKGRGSIHPVNQVIEDVCRHFHSMGYTIVDGPELETDYYNFEALNVPSDHPARDMQDSFYIQEEWMLRTHTSNVQIRVMENMRPPLRVLSPGKVYRRDNDATHSPMFHQIEGFLVDRDVTFANLKAVLGDLVREIFGKGRKLRFRPSFFPFTEPSAEVDMDCIFCDGAGCRICSGGGWLEIGGAGMIHPNVLRGMRIDPEEYSGFAFGVGADRIAMLKYKIPNIRLLFDGDVRFLLQFR